MGDMYIALADDGAKFKTIALPVRAKIAHAAAAYAGIHCRSLLLLSFDNIAINNKPNFKNRNDCLQL